MDTIIPEATALHQARSATIAMEQTSSKPFADGLDTPGTPGTGTDKAGPTQGSPAATDTAGIPTAEAGSPTKGTTTTVLPLHAGLLNTQTEVPHQFIIRSVP